MPITLTPLTPSNTLGWGVSVNVVSDFIGPLPTGSQYRLTLSTDSEGQNVIASWVIGTTDKSAQLNMSTRELGFHQGTWSAATGEQVHLLAVLEEPGNVAIDSGILTAPFQQHLQAPIMVTQDLNAKEGGLTSEQALQLSETHASTALTKLVDTLTLIELTNGPSEGPIDEAIFGAIFGVIIRLHDIPPDLAPSTPDGDYFVKTLAVVRIFRGIDLWMRVPIHTSDKMIPMAGEGVVAAVSVAVANISILDLSIRVDFLPGVTGQVFLMRFP